MKHRDGDEGVRIKGGVTSKSMMCISAVATYVSEIALGT